MNYRALVSRWFVAGLPAVLLAACSGGGGSPGSADGSAPAADDGATRPTISLVATGVGGITADTLTLVSSVRVGRTTFDYTYTVRITNNSGVALQAATATVSSAAATTVVTDSSLTFGDLAIGAAATSSDTFTIRQDRSAPVADANLTVMLTGTPTIPPKSRELIEQALARGDIDGETALVYEVYAVFGDPRLPAAYQGDDSGVMDSTVMGEVAGRLATLSPENRAILEPFTIPPVYAGSWWQQGEAATATPAAASTRVRPAAIPCPGCPDDLWSNVSQAGGHVKVWWQTIRSGDEAYANQILNAVEGKIWPDLTTLMGREPLSDLLQSRNGGDGMLDIYLVRFTGSTIGLTVAYPFGCEARPTYVGIDPSKASSWLPSAVAHEFMHTIQFSYDLAQACSDYEWLSEGTATWAMDFVYPNENHEHYYADDYLDSPEKSIFAGGHYPWYGTYLLPFYLAHNYVPAVVGTIWNNTTQHGSLEAVEQAIPGGFRERWPEFALYNWNRDRVHFYQDWDSLSYTAGGDLTNMPWRVPKWNGPEPVVLAGDPDKKLPFDRLRTDGQANLSTNYYHYEFPYDSVRTVAFYNGFTWDVQEETDPDLGTRLVPHEWTDPARDKAKVQAILKIGGAWQDPVDWSGEGQRYFCRDRASERVEEMVLIFSNAEHQVQPPGNGTLFPPGEPPTLWTSNMGCFEWQGTADFTNTVDGITETRHANVTWTPAAQGTYFEATGTLEWSISGTDSGGCVYSGNSTVLVDSSPIVERSMATFNDYSAGQVYRGYYGFGYARAQVTQTIVCPDGDGGSDTFVEPRDAGMWFPGYGEAGFKVGAQGNVIDGLFIDVDEGRWEWHFDAQRE